MNPVTVAVLQSGIIDKGMLQELIRWGAPLEIPEKLPVAPKTAAEAVSLLDEALQSEGLVLTRDTDLDILKQFLATAAVCPLHLELADGTCTDSIVSVGHTALGEFVIPWRGETIKDLMTNGQTYLLVDGHKVFFQDVRDLFYGDVQAFMVCTPSAKELAQ